MTTHLEDKPKSGAFKRNNWWYHYATLCGMSFTGGGAEHQIAAPSEAPTCEICAAINAERKVSP